MQLDLGIATARPLPRVEQIQNTTEKTRKIYIETETEPWKVNQKWRQAGEDEVILELHVIFL